VAARRPPRALPLSVVIGAIAVIAGAVVWFHRKDESTLNGSVARCTAVQRTAHAAQCRALDTAPAVLVSGPIDASGRPAGTHRVTADSTRRFSIRLQKGTYDVFVLIGNAAIEPKGGTARAVQHLRDAGIAGLRVAPGPGFRVVGRISTT
jgi:hypothetical protein